MSFLRLKQVQCALADGRLDEAHDLLKDDVVRSYRLGQKLATKLIQALVSRGQLHLAAGRMDDAMADCGKAAVLGGHDPGVAELRARLMAQAEARRRAADLREQTVAAARQHGREGFLSKGLAMLRETGEADGAVAQTQQALELDRTRADAALACAAAALAKEDWTAAGHHLTTARRLRPFDPRVQELAGRVTDEALTRAWRAASDGRLDTAASLLRAVAPVADDRLTVRELREVIKQVHGATTCLRAGEARSAARNLRRLKTLLPEANWIDEAIQLADQISVSREALEVGPLGLVWDRELSPTTAAPAEREPETDAAETTTSIAYHGGDGHDFRRGHGILPRQFILQVDGQGGALVVCDESVSIGPVSSAQRPTIGLIAEPGAPTIIVRRAQDDYFLQCAAPVNVNGKPVQEHLLADGDKIALSPRCRLQFRLPHAASTTAVLELTGARLLRADLRRIVLLDRQIMIGPGAACHLRADAAQPVVLCMRDGQMTAGSLALSMNAAVTVGDLSLRMMEV